MQATRLLSILCVFVLLSVTLCYGQGTAVYSQNPAYSQGNTYYGMSVQGPVQQQPNQQPVLQQQAHQQQPSQQQPIRAQTLQVPPKQVVQNGVTVYQHNPVGLQNPVPQQYVVPADQLAPGERTMPQGFGSSYPTGLQLEQQPVVRQPHPAQYPPPQVYVAQAQPVVGNQPVPHQASQPIMVTPGQQVAPGSVAGTQNGRPAYVHVGRSESDTRLPPFLLTPEEERELDDFLVRWERFSSVIKLYEVEFTAYEFTPDENGYVAQKPTKSMFGSFKYVAPNRFVYHLEGEWIDGKKVKRNPDDEKTRLILEEKIIINEKALYKYDFVAKTVYQINIPPELARKGIADSPLPLIFGANATDLKRRFSMRMQTIDQNKERYVWLKARPLQIEDQTEFLELELMINPNTFHVVGLQKHDKNGKSRTSYALQQPKINPPLGPILEKWKEMFTATIPAGWSHQQENMPTFDSDPNRSPAAVPAGAQPQFAQPVGDLSTGRQPATSNTIPLYSPQ